MTEALPRRLIKRVVPPAIRQSLRRTQSKLQTLRTYRVIQRSPMEAVRFILSNRELDNFTYRVANLDELATFLAGALAVDPATARRYIAELDDDTELEREMRARLSSRKDRNQSMPFGRRLGWYAVARVVRPRLLIETGVHDGLGSIALLRALERNAKEGAEGRLISFDIDPTCGWLIPEWRRARHEVVIGDSLVGLRDRLTDAAVDMFVHDSDHRYQHEAAEFAIVAPHLASAGVLISDNAHSTSALRDFSAESGFEFRFWREIPSRHFYPGAGIGFARRPAGNLAGG